MLRYALRPANLFTATSLFCGLYSIMLSAGANGGDSQVLFQAAILIMVAGLFDMLDGPVARITRTQSDFGIQFDSLADVVSFGVAPGVLLYKWGLDTFGGWGFFFAFLFTLAGALRLARFNVQTGHSDPRFSTGLTITSAGMMVAALVIHHHHVKPGELANHLTVLAFALLLSYLMVSNVRFRTTKWFRPNLATMVGVALFVFGVLAINIIFDVTFVFVAIGYTYIGWGLVEEVVRVGRRAARRGATWYAGGLGATHDPGYGDEDDEEPEPRAL